MDSTRSTNMIYLYDLINSMTYNVGLTEDSIKSVLVHADTDSSNIRAARVALTARFGGVLAGRLRIRVNVKSLATWPTTTATVIQEDQRRRTIIEVERQYFILDAMIIRVSYNISHGRITNILGELSETLLRELELVSDNLTNAWRAVLTAFGVPTGRNGSDLTPFSPTSYEATGSEARDASEPAGLGPTVNLDLVPNIPTRVWRAIRTALGLSQGQVGSDLTEYPPSSGETANATGNSLNGTEVSPPSLSLARASVVPRHPRRKPVPISTVPEIGSPRVLPADQQSGVTTREEQTEILQGCAKYTANRRLYNEKFKNNIPDIGVIHKEHSWFAAQARANAALARHIDYEEREPAASKECQLYSSREADDEEDSQIREAIAASLRDMHRGTDVNGDPGPSNRQVSDRRGLLLGKQPVTDHDEETKICDTTWRRAS